MLTGQISWEGRTEELRQYLVTEGKHASQVAVIYSEQFGRPVTRNMILGAAHRAGLSGWAGRGGRPRRPYGSVAVKRGRLNNHTRVLLPKHDLPAAPVGAPTPLNIPLLETKQFHCRWIEDGDLCCGHDITYRSLCAFHASISYQPARGRRVYR